LEKTEKRSRKKDEKTNKNLTEYRRSFINYFSLGYDARVGFGFDKLRTQSRCCNKFMYFWEGCKKSCCRKTLKLNGFIDSFLTLKVDDNFFDSRMSGGERPRVEPQEIFKTRTMIEMESKKSIDNISKSKSANPKINVNAKLSEEYNEIVLKGDPVTLICQNINHYMGGVSDIWKKSGDQLGIELYNANMNPETINLKEKDLKEKEMFQDLIRAEQHFGDGKIEFFSFDSGIHLGFEKLFSGFANKVYQGTGPILLKFKDYGSYGSESDERENRVYLNIDGEYFNVVKARELRVRSNKKFLDGKVKFLYKKKN